MPRQIDGLEQEQLENCHCGRRLSRVLNFQPGRISRLEQKKEEKTDVKAAINEVN